MAASRGRRHALFVCARRWRCRRVAGQLETGASGGVAENGDKCRSNHGGDACRKICILSSLVFGKHVYPDQVYTKGIRNITLEDVQLAQDFGGAVKLIGAVKRLENGKILPTVMPMVVMNESLISHVNGVFNAVMVWGDGVDKTLFYGRGAGKLPTASAVLGDLIDEVKQNDTVESQSWEPAEAISPGATFGFFLLKITRSPSFTLMVTLR